MKCDRCGNDATIHITEIRRGISSDRHLCETCAETILPLEENDYSDYLDVLPPRHSTYLSDEGEPTKGEVEMTGVQQHVVVVDLAAGTRGRVGLRSGDSFSPVWSPDSKRLAICHAAELRPSLVLVEPGAPGLRRFMRTTYAEPAGWSRDSQHVAFSHLDEGSRIAVTEVCGDRLRHLESEDEVNDFLPVWSPADDRIAFVGLRVEQGDEGPTECSVYAAEAAAGSRRRLATLSDVLVTTLGWSGDTRFLAGLTIPFSGTEPEDIMRGAIEQRLYLLRADRESAKAGLLVRSALSFAWLPRVEGFCEGPTLAALEMPRGDLSALRTVFLDPRTGRRLTLAEGLTFPGAGLQGGHLSRDGKTLAAVRSSDARRVVFVNLASRATREIDPEGEVAWLGWLPAADDLAALIRDADGTRLDVLSPAGARRTVTRFERKGVFDAPLMALSPDGKRAAVELHTPVS